MELKPITVARKRFTSNQSLQLKLPRMTQKTSNQVKVLGQTELLIQPRPYLDLGSILQEDA